jgi:hypothetical protein
MAETIRAFPSESQFPKETGTADGGLKGVPSPIPIAKPIGWKELRPAQGPGARGNFSIFSSYAGGVYQDRKPDSFPGEPARLDTRPVASGYLDGTLTRWNIRHCHAATKT